MDRTMYNRGVMDLLVGIICGAIMHFSMTAYIIVFSVAVIGALLIAMFGGDPSVYGNDEKGNFRGAVVLLCIIIVNVGVVFGWLVMGLAF